MSRRRSQNRDHTRHDTYHHEQPTDHIHRRGHHDVHDQTADAPPPADDDDDGEFDDYDSAEADDGEETYGDDAYGEDAYGEDAYGEDAYGDETYGKEAYGEAADSDEADGDEADEGEEGEDGEEGGEDAYGEDAYGEETYGEEAYGEAADSDEADGDEADEGEEGEDGEEGDDGEEADGEDAYGDEAYGEDADGEHEGGLPMTSSPTRQTSTNSILNGHRIAMSPKAPHAAKVVHLQQQQPETSSVRIGDDYQADVPAYEAAVAAAASSSSLGRGARGASSRGGGKSACDDAAEQLFAPGAQTPKPVVLPERELYCFPLPSNATEHAAFGVPMGADHAPLSWDTVEEKRLRWKLVQLGWVAGRDPLPKALQATKRRRWSAAERSQLTEGIITQGKHFRSMLPKFPGRSVHELIEKYYLVKLKDNAYAGIDPFQDERNVRDGPCGTVGCVLHDNHHGPHVFRPPSGPRARKRKERADDFDFYAG